MKRHEQRSTTMEDHVKHVRHRTTGGDVGDVLVQLDHWSSVLNSCGDLELTVKIGHFTGKFLLEEIDLLRMLFRLRRSPTYLRLAVTRRCNCAATAASIIEGTYFQVLRLNEKNPHLL